MKVLLNVFALQRIRLLNIVITLKIILYILQNLRFIENILTVNLVNQFSKNNSCINIIEMDIVLLYVFIPLTKFIFLRKHFKVI